VSSAILIPAEEQMRLKVLVALFVAVAAWRLGSPGAPVIAAEKAAAATSPSSSVNATA